MKKETRKKIGSLLIAGTILVSGIGIDRKGSNKIKEYVGPMEVLANEYDENAIGVYINNERTEFDVEPSIINDRVMVPMRKIFESLGSTIEYNSNTKTITGVTEEGHKLEHQIGTNIIKIDNKTLEFDTNSLIKNDRTLVPIRFVGESLGADVYYWDEKLSYLSPETPRKSVDIIKESDELNNKKHSAIKESLRVNTNLTNSEKNFFMNEMKPFYQDCAKYLDNYSIEEKKNLKVFYSDEKTSLAGDYCNNNITYYNAKSFQEKLASQLGKGTCAHEYFHALQGRKSTDFLIERMAFYDIIIEGGAAMLEDEYFDGNSYGYEKNIFKLLCEVFGTDIMGYLMISGNNRIFCSELQKYLGTIEEMDKFLTSMNIIEYDYVHNNDTSKDVLDTFYNYIKKIYESKYEIEIENDRLVTAYLDFACHTNKLGIEPINKGYSIIMVGVDGINYFNNENSPENYIVWVNERIGTDNSTLYFGKREYSLNERYIDKSKVKKLTR